jgi:hypothetical protein
MIIQVKPAEGLKVYNPETNAPLPDGGGKVQDSGYWRRQLKFKCVEIIAVPEPVPTVEIEQAPVKRSYVKKTAK